MLEILVIVKWCIYAYALAFMCPLSYIVKHPILKILKLQIWLKLTLKL